MAPNPSRLKLPNPEAFRYTAWASQAYGSELIKSRICCSGSSRLKLIAQTQSTAEHWPELGLQSFESPGLQSLESQSLPSDLRTICVFHTLSLYFFFSLPNSSNILLVASCRFHACQLKLFFHIASNISSFLVLDSQLMITFWTFLLSPYCWHPYLLFWNWRQLL